MHMYRHAKRQNLLAAVIMNNSRTHSLLSRYSKKIPDTISWMLKPKAEERPFIDQVIERIHSIQHEEENRV